GVSPERIHEAVRHLLMVHRYRGLAQGQARLSAPLVHRFLYDQEAQARITAVSVPAERYLSKVGDPSEQTVADLYAKYKDQLPGPAVSAGSGGAGSADGFGIGYRVPARVKLEYLAVPFSRLKARAEVNEDEA